MSFLFCFTVYLSCCRHDMMTMMIHWWVNSVETIIFANKINFFYLCFSRKMEIEAKRKKEEEDRIMQEKANQAAAVSFIIVFCVDIWRGYLFMPSTRHDLTQDLFYCVDFEEGKVRHEPKFMPCFSMLVIGSLGVMWTMLAFAKSPGIHVRWTYLSQIHLMWRSSAMCI